VDAKFYNTYGTYHSVYDDLVFMSIVDPEYYFVRSMAQFFSLMGYELASQSLLPYNLTDLGNWIVNAFNNVANSTISMHCNASNTTSNYLKSAVSSLKTQMDAFEQKVSAVVASPQSTQTNDNINVINQVYMNIGKKFLISQGLQHRTFYKNTLFAPSLLNGYSPYNLPIISDVLSQVYENCNSTLLSDAFNQTASVFANVSAYLDLQIKSIVM